MKVRIFAAKLQYIIEDEKETIDDGTTVCWADSERTRLGEN